MLTLLFEKVFPYLIAAVLGASAGAWITATIDDAKLAHEKTTHAQDVEKLNSEMNGLTAAAALAEQQAIADHHMQEGRITTLDDQLTKEKQAHETDTHTYTAALAAGTQRLRVAVRSCSSAHDVPAAPGSPSVDDGPPAYAYIDGAVASRVFTVAGDDQREIDKLKGLQGYVCSVRPDLPACAQAAP